MDLSRMDLIDLHLINSDGHGVGNQSTDVVVIEVSEIR